MSERLDRDTVLALRLHTQGLAGQRLGTAAEAVQFHVATQSQDFGNAKWSVGQRCHGLRDQDVQREFDEGRVLRTHVLRPTWHFVHPADIRWLLQLTAPHVHRLNSLYYRRAGLDQEALRKAAGVLERNLSGNRSLRRSDIGPLMNQIGLPNEGHGLAYILMHAELEGMICSGPTQGKQQTYMLLDEVAQVVRSFTDEEALASLTLRFFRSHGPATDRDFARWSGLTLTKVRTGIELVNNQLVEIEVEGLRHWMGPWPDPLPTIPDLAWLLPEYDECCLTYPVVNFPDAVPGDHPADYYRPVIISGKRWGTWKRTIQGKSVDLELRLFGQPGKHESALLEEAVQGLSAYLESPVNSTIIV